MGTESEIHQSPGFFRITFKRLKKRKSAMFGLGVIMVLFVTAGFADLLAPGKPNIMNADLKLQSPSWQHPLGTDVLGRDIMSRILYGGRVSLKIGFFSIGLAALLGMTIGTLSGYFGGAVDHLIMRFVDLFLAFPVFLLAIVIVVTLGPGQWTVITAIGISYMPAFSRIIRGSVLTVKETEYIEACRTLGYGHLRIITRHVVPNCLAPLIVYTTLTIGVAIIIEASLSFLGLGIRPPTPAWGYDLQAGMSVLEFAPHVVIFPGLAISLTVLGFNMLGDGLRDALDPRLKT
jgi:peptide/nickel transport system permease protein